ncbi:hypothetical protein DdX_12529 [Ditylenchus destructor]|uniref:Saposin B-type domain-containing protein n=1 Tax=Ditylenchus destructor TaxID=166010 RepID=A0AAD4R3I2_9BILA|nr:hypothetical protein DdX_12529 [Ditylenchus destructor]
MPALRLNFAVIVLMAVGLGSVKSVGFEARSGEIFARGKGLSACEVCEIFVQVFDEAFEPMLPMMPDGWIALNYIKPMCHVIPRHPSVSQGLLEFCELINGKERDFGKAYVKYYNHGKTGEPCKEVGIC